MARIALSVAAEDTDAARRILERHADLIDAAELRLDLMARFDVQALLRDRPCPVIVTCRPPREGGRYGGPEDERLDVLRQAAAAGAEHIDCEWDAFDRLGPLGGTAKVIVSRHFFHHMPDTLPETYAELAAMQPDIVKVVGMARNVCDAAAPLALLGRAAEPAIALAMGGRGVLSRILASAYGAYLTFAAAESEALAAPGQLTVQRMRDEYFAHLMDRHTRVHMWLTPCEPPEQRVGEVNAALREAGQNAVVVPVPVSGEDPAEIIAAFRAIGVEHFSIHPDCGEFDRIDQLDELAVDFFARRNQ